MSTRDRAARTATRLMAYRIARASGIGALAVFIAGLFASRRPAPRERLGMKYGLDYTPVAPMRGLMTVKDLAQYLTSHPNDYVAVEALAQAVLEHIAREEARDGNA